MNQDISKKDDLKLRDNLVKLMSECNINAVELSRTTNLPISTIRRIRQADDANPTISSLIPIAEFFSITLNQLIGIDPLPNDRIIGAYLEKRENWLQIPIINWKQVLTYPSPNIDLNQVSTISTDATLSEKSYALSVEEDNWPGFLKGTILVIDPSATPEHRDYIVTHKEGQSKASFHQLHIDDDQKYLRPLNPAYLTKLFDDTYKILGTLIQIRMDVKNHD